MATSFFAFPAEISISLTFFEVTATSLKIFNQAVNLGGKESLRLLEIFLHISSHKLNLQVCLTALTRSLAQNFEKRDMKFR